MSSVLNLFDLKSSQKICQVVGHVNLGFEDLISSKDVKVPLQYDLVTEPNWVPLPYTIIINVLVINIWGGRDMKVDCTQEWVTTEGQQCSTGKSTLFVMLHAEKALHRWSGL